MKKYFENLYSCNARCNAEELVSYRTPLVRIEKVGDVYRAGVYRYPTNTSAQHLRKYVKWLKEKGYKSQAYAVECALDFGVKNKLRYVVGYFNCVDGTVEAK